MESTSDKTVRPKRRWLTFSVRGLMVLMLLVSVPLGLIGRDVWRSKAEEALVRDIELIRGHAQYDYIEEIPPSPDLCFAPVKLRKHTPQGHWLVRRVFGENIYSYVTEVSLRWSKDPNSVLPRIDRFSRLEDLTLPEGALTDASVDGIARLTKLRTLYLDGTEITPGQMRRLATMDSLTVLVIVGPSANDKVVQQVSCFPNLKRLSLNMTSLTDEGMYSIGGLTALESLNIDYAQQVTNEGLSYLIDLPNLVSLAADRTRINNYSARILAEMPAMQDAWICADNPDVDYGEYRSYDLPPMNGKDRSIAIMEDFIHLSSTDPAAKWNYPNPPKYDPTPPPLDEPLPPIFADVYNDPFIPAEAKGKPATVTQSP